MKKKHLIILAILSVVVFGAIYYFKDTRDMSEVAAEQEESIKEAAEKLENNDLFNDDATFEDVIEAPLALDTTKAEK